MQKIPTVTSNRFEQEEEEEDYYKPEKLGKFYSDCFIIYESRSNKKKHQLKQTILKRHYK